MRQITQSKASEILGVNGSFLQRYRDQIPLSYEKYGNQVVLYNEDEIVNRKEEILAFKAKKIQEGRLRASERMVKLRAKQKQSNALDMLLSFDTLSTNKGYEIADALIDALRVLSIKLTTLNDVLRDIERKL